MGCDIHVLTEKKYYEKWVNTDNWQINPSYDEDDKRELLLNEVFHDRDYELFTVLADVRNDYNFCECISEPKGLPDDMHEMTKKYIDEYWGNDGHSHSWFTLKELYDYWLEMPTKVRRTGILIGDVLKKFDENGKEPEEWCQGFWGNAKSARREWEAEYDILYKFMTSIIERFCEEHYIYFIKKEDYKTNERIKTAIEKYGDDFRVIFFFDN